MTYRHSRSVPPYSQWPAARLLSARAYNAVRHGGPTTLTPKGQTAPYHRAVHAIFVADRAVGDGLLLRRLAKLEEQRSCYGASESVQAQRRAGRRRTRGL